MKVNYNKPPLQTIIPNGREVSIFEISGGNIDEKVVEEFGEEWLKFHEFSDQMISKSVGEYFDIINESIINKNSYVIDIGCGSGRWTKVMAPRAGFIEAVDPSNAIFAADRLLKNIDNIRLTKASINTLPFDDETFDLAMCVGVLHHIPNTQQAMVDCVKKVKRGGYFYTYLYHDISHKGFFTKTAFAISDTLRRGISRLPVGIKKFVCDIIAVSVYLPLVSLSRFFSWLGMKGFAKKIPLADYSNKAFFVMRNDALDRFGTRLEQRFTRQQVEQMMKVSGLGEIVISDGTPYWHGVGKKL
ncbi:MAG TPA: class I SAM-dependent methyltransferase [Chitinophagaceae bacterium]|nr:class I SAM-dependent methyltransferase [Chitinophagaceae bacterium]